MFKKKKKEEPKKDMRFALLPEYTFTEYGAVLQSDRDAIYKVVEVEFITEGVDFVDECIIKYSNHSFKIPSNKLYTDYNNAKQDCEVYNYNTIKSMGIKLNRVCNELDDIKRKLREIFK